ncbi:DUF6585 family protein [Streptomyces sp. NPDC017248]|uniref:DUF6585 family protein n=1 Tax=unclassified Streptomyces TaxID=2593676 RepID=UPI00379CDB9A
MSGEAVPRGREEELLLARVSAAAGRAQLGRRLVTYRPPRAEPGTGRTAGADTPRLPGAGGGPVARVRRLLRIGGGSVARARRLPRVWGPVTGTGARLDLYEYGMTAAAGGRACPVHVVRFDTTVVHRRRVLSSRGVTRALSLVDVDGERIMLRCGDFGRPEEWWPAIRRGVVDAQLPHALAALRRGARLAFGPVWLTRDEVGSGGRALRWAQVQRIETGNGVVAVRVAGRWQVWTAVASGIPNLCVLHALAEHLAGAATDD